MRAKNKEPVELAQLEMRGVRKRKKKKIEKKRDKMI